MDTAALSLSYLFQILALPVLAFRLARIRLAAELTLFRLKQAQRIEQRSLYYSWKLIHDTEQQLTREGFEFGLSKEFAALEFRDFLQRLLNNLDRHASADVPAI